MFAEKESISFDKKEKRIPLDKQKYPKSLLQKQLKKLKNDKRKLILKI